jgi:molybdate transport system permease protein
LLEQIDFAAIRLTLELATTSTLILLVVGTPIAWWLARTRSRWKGVVGALVALPLVLPPTVIGFYLLLTLGPHGTIGQFTQWLGIGLLPSPSRDWWWGRSFTPCPSWCSPSRMPSPPAATVPWKSPPPSALGLGPLFYRGLAPGPAGFRHRCHPGFAHTVGEFGVVLMLGGNIPEQTRVVSVAIYDHVEALEYAEAHVLAGGMLVFSFLVLLALYSRNSRPWT